MQNYHLSLFFALGSTITFATSSLVFAEFSRRISALWMNCFKCIVAFAFLALTIPITTGWTPASFESLTGLVLSGFIGLNLGDLFLLNAFAKLGAARTLMVFGFQPLFLGFAAHLVFGQKFNPHSLLAVFFLIACLTTFALERFRQERVWGVNGLIYALIGVSLDASGVLLSRAAFEHSPQLPPLEGNFYRCFGALLGFALIARFQPIRLIEGYKQLSTIRTRALVIAASFGGTYLALLLYLSAVKIGHLASIASIGITGPIFAAALECLIYRRAPSRYLITAFIFFAAGFYILITSSAT